LFSDAKVRQESEHYVRYNNEFNIYVVSTKKELQ
jgi:hypothetical protein